MLRGVHAVVMPSDDKIRASRFPRIVVVKQKCPMAAMITRRKNERNTTTGRNLDGHTKGKMDTRIQHENEPSGVPSAVFWHAKDFEPTHEVAAEAGKTLSAVKRRMKMRSRMVGCIHDHTRI